VKFRTAEEGPDSCSLKLLHEFGEKFFAVKGDGCIAVLSGGDVVAGCVVKVADEVSREFQEAESVRSDNFIVHFFLQFNPSPPFDNFAYKIVPGPLLLAFGHVLDVTVVLAPSSERLFLAMMDVAEVELFQPLSRAKRGAFLMNHERTKPSEPNELSILVQ
tara:strand:- start:55 stop:537 length:483 start_codon:yes stop_codon:yes gene_type:complete